MKKRAKKFSARLGKTWPCESTFFWGGIRGCQIAKTGITYELNILQASITFQNLQNTGSYSSETHKIAFALTC